MTAADLLPTIAPEFADVDATAAIAIAEMQVGEGLCGDKRPLLVAYLTAHMLSIGERGGGAGGSIASLSEGGLSISYSTSGVTGSLASTSYGAEYDRLSRACVFSPRTRVRL